MPLVPRELEITYGGFVVGGATERIIDGHTRVEDGFILASYEFSFIVYDTTEAGFTSKCTAVEVAFRKPRQDLVVKQGSATLLSLKQSDNTGLDADPIIQKGEHKVDTGRSRRYTVRINFGRPANNVDTEHLRFSTVNVAYNEARRKTVTMSGTWTATPTTGAAYDTFLANIATWAAAQLTLVDAAADWEEQGRPRVEFNSTNKILEFTLVYQQLLYPDAGKSSSVPDDPQLVNQIFRLNWITTGPGDSPGTGVDFGQSGGGFSTGSGGADTGVMTGGSPNQQGGASTARLGRVALHWEASVDSTLTIDLVSKYNGTIRPWLITEAAKVMAAGYGPLVLVNESFDPDRTDNRIAVDLEFWCVGPANIIEQRITTKESKPSYGWVLVARWDGKPLSKYRYQGPAQQLRVVTETRRVYRVTPDVLGKEPSPMSNSVPVSRDSDQTPVMIGLPGNQFQATDVNIYTVLEFYDSGGGSTSPPPTSSQGGGGDGSVATSSPGTNFFGPNAGVVTSQLP
jgi:hypothetical protein